MDDMNTRRNILLKITLIQKVIRKLNNLNYRSMKGSWEFVCTIPM